MTRRHWLLVPLLAAPVLGLGVHYAYWRMAADRLTEGLAIWRTQRQQAGWTSMMGPAEAGGYPLAATVSLRDVVVQSAGAGIQGGLRWQAGRVVLRVTLWQPRLLQIQVEGTQQLRLAEQPEIPFQADRLRLVLPLEHGLPRWGELSITQLRAGLPIGGIIIGDVRGRADLRPAAPQGEAAITFALRAEKIHLPEQRSWPLGPDITQAALDGTVGGPLPRGGAPAASLGQAAGQWRDGGGTVEISELALQWGKLDVHASATLALDAQLQPMGTGMARLRGHDAALDALVAAGALGPSVARMARTMIALFATPATPPDGADGAVELPLTLQERRLLSRQLPLAKLPLLPWPGG